MAEKEPKKSLCHINVCAVENGYNISVGYENEASLSQKAGWVPYGPSECKQYVAKTKADLKKRFSELVDES